MCTQLFSGFQLFVTPWTVSFQARLSMTIQPSNSTPGYLPMRNKNLCPPQNLRIKVYHSFIIVASNWKWFKSISKIWNQSNTIHQHIEMSYWYMLLIHTSTLAWKIPWTEEPGRLQSMESLRVGHNWATSLLFFTFVHWRRKWQPTPVFLPAESQGRGSLVGCPLLGRKESYTTEAT